MAKVWTVLRTVAIFCAVYLMVAAGLIVSQTPRAEGDDTLQFDVLQGRKHEPGPVEMVTARDSKNIAFRRHVSGRSGAPLLVLVHGSGAHGASYDWLASELAARDVADVIVPDLRGHGASGGSRGDVDYIGQLEDDLADLVEVQARDGQRVVFAGHSSGGGLIVRMAGGQHRDLMDGAILLAPFLKYNAPTMRENSGGWAHAATRRIIGLEMLNAVGISMLNRLSVIAFNIPETLSEAVLVQAYSYRMNRSYAPRSDYQTDLAALPETLLLVGERDEAFHADKFAPVMQDAGAPAQVRVLNEIGHLDIINAPRTVDAMASFLKGE